MNRLILAAALLLPTAAMAQQPAQPEMVLIPRALAEAAAAWVAQPNAGNAVQLYAGLTACIADNPDHGVVRHMGSDQCPVVTAALAERAKAAQHPAPATKDHP